MEQFLSSEAEQLSPLLAAFDALATEGTVTGAAAAMGVPQSSLSRRLRAVEEVLGVPLLQRAGRGIELTPQGREFHARTRGLLRSLDETIGEVSRDADPEEGLVRFGFPLSLSPLSVPGALAAFHAKYPRIRLHVVQGYGEELVRQLRTGELDLAVVIPAPDEVPTTILGHQPIECYVAKSHPLSTRDSVSLRELKNEEFIANPRSFHLRRMVDRWCAGAGFVPNVPFEIAEFDSIRALTAKGLGVALLPPPESEIPGLARIPLRDRCTRTVGLSAAIDEPTIPVRRLHHFLSTHREELGSAIDATPN